MLEGREARVSYTSTIVTRLTSSNVNNSVNTVTNSGYNMGKFLQRLKMPKVTQKKKKGYFE
jgi:glutaredoxin-related protein